MGLGAGLEDEDIHEISAIAGDGMTETLRALCRVIDAEAEAERVEAEKAEAEKAGAGAAGDVAEPVR